MSYVKPLAELNRTDLPLAGGKGANLGALINAGMPVPPGFCITTDAYRAFVAANELQPRILDLLRDLQPDSPDALEAASAAIRVLFEVGSVPDNIAAGVRSAYTALDQHDTPVAVRSSATAEDLPDLSFAGQQDTYLNVVGAASVLDHMVRCWASLWTARAIGYRSRNHIPQDEVALAVVVQQMIQSEASGVLFTANPLTGARHETVIDATIGLGEALVSGLVEPDHIVLDTAHGRILSKTLGAKALAIRGDAGGGTSTIEGDASQQQAISDEHSIALARLGEQAAAHFGLPQDMEWALADGKLYVLQSRAITSLYPLPENTSPDPLEVMVSFGALQGMLDPITPLGQDVFRAIVVGVGQRFGMQLTVDTQRTFRLAGERFFLNMTGLFRSHEGRQLLGVMAYAGDPASADTVRRLLDDPRFAVRPGGMRLSTRLRLMRALAPVIAGTVYNLLSPRQGRERLERKVQEALIVARTRVDQAHDGAELAHAVDELMVYVPRYVFPYLLPGVIAGQLPWQIVRRLSCNLPDGPALAMELTRGLPHNVTTEMDLALWHASRAIDADPASRATFARCDAGWLTSDYLAGRLPAAAQQAVASFLQRYGSRGLAEIDLGRARWSDEPTHIFQVLKSYLLIQDEASSPTAMFAAGAAKANAAGEQIVVALRKTPGGWFKARIARWMIRRTRELAGLRETPKFTIIQVFGVLHQALLAEGAKLTAQGIVAKPEDIFFLHSAELKIGDLSTAREHVAERRQVYNRECARRQIPRIMLSDGTTFYDSIPAGDSDAVLTGSPVSAGTVEGIVHVVFDPRSAQLAPGEILVCPGTDPAWTPLFLAAGGLVMEVGGMMTHGSVVAREYGIPAVVGVGQATMRLKTGQRVRVDGSSGQIIILDEAIASSPE
jgi:rifampicin phosphotransferase